MKVSELAWLAAMCAEGHCDEMAVNLLPAIAARREEVAHARTELDHLDAELATLERRLRPGPTDLPIFPPRERRDDAADDQVHQS
jgi:hypothetical protein